MFGKRFIWVDTSCEGPQGNNKGRAVLVQNESEMIQWRNFG